MSFLGDAVIALTGAGASLFGANKSADAIEDASDAATQLQREAFQTQLGLAKPGIQVGNSALDQLAQIFGLQRPDPVDFNQLGGAATNQPLSPQRVNELFQQEFGRQADPEALQFYSSGEFSERDLLNEIRNSAEFRTRADAGTLPVQGQQTTGTAPTTGTLDLESLVANNPLIKFNREQGELAINRGAAARGLNASGGTLQDLSRFNQDLSGAGIQQFALNPLFQLAGFGNQASGQLSTQAGNSGNNQSQLALTAGEARGSAFQNAGNTIGNALSDFALARTLRN